MAHLASYLKTSNLTQGAFADALGVSQPTVNRWLKGQAKPSWEKAAEIERVTGGMVPVSAWVSHYSSPSSEGPEVSACKNEGAADADAPQANEVSHG
ncbi:helix-turn-helix transcriptional regulator [Roseibacterium sp. SDUM158017]|uniref:transcriptional regulator n=1 Tax=Roseicyclus salinarum TaxID=3036773 RepID=UPI00241503A7|nr:helix-turn-helix transcriptional regulator [Roseibacterium sp. SDUM158017]MDG4650087.1 helix-turn-helix transcriptional regulator [Roseibacterium sp. SDUM158017]